MNILSTQNLIKRFEGVQAVDHLSISIERGLITSIIGPNGSGKSTLVNTLTGVLPIDGGAVVIRDTTRLQKIKPFDVPAYGITRTFQDVRLFEQMPVLDNILVVLTERGVLSSLFERHSELHLKQAEEVLRTVGLWEKRYELAENLSYGQRKLLEIGRAIAMDSEIYLFDEPFAGLFPEMVKVVSSVLRDLKQKNKAVVLIEHNMDLIREMSDHVFVLDAGKLLAEGRPQEVLSNKKVIEAYLGD